MNTFEINISTYLHKTKRMIGRYANIISAVLFELSPKRFICKKKLYILKVCVNRVPVIPIGKVFAWNM